MLQRVIGQHGKTNRFPATGAHRAELPAISFINKPGNSALNEYALILARCDHLTMFMAASCACPRDVAGGIGGKLAQLLASAFGAMLWRGRPLMHDARQADHARAYKLPPVIHGAATAVRLVFGFLARLASRASTMRRASAAESLRRLLVPPTDPILAKCSRTDCGNVLI
jgi:hypothetical protein